MMLRRGRGKPEGFPRLKLTIERRVNECTDFRMRAE